MKLKQLNWPLIVTGLLILFSLVLPSTWFSPGHMIMHGDPMFPYDPARNFLDQFSIWGYKWNLGSDYNSLSVAQIPQLLLAAIPAWLGATDQLAEKVYFTIWFVLPMVTMALYMSLLVKKLKISQWAIPISALMYNYNLYRLAIFGDNNHFLVYGFLPLGLYFITLAFEEEKSWLPPAIGFALMSVMLSRAGTNPPMDFMFWVPVVLYSLILAIVNWRSWRRTLAASFGLVGLTLLTNLFWLGPFLMLNKSQSDLVSNGNLNWLSGLSVYTSFARVVRLMGAWDWYGDWWGEPYKPYAQIYKQQIWQSLSLLPLIFALTPFFFRKAWNRYSLVFVLLVLAGLVFAQGTHPPMTQIFTWAVVHVPFFWSFRSPWYKFSTLIAFGYACLAGLGVGLIVDRLKATRLRFILPVLLLIGFILPLVLTRPFLTGQVWSKPSDVSSLGPDITPYPTDIRQAADWLNGQPGDTAVALLPYQAAAVYRWGLQAPWDPLYYMSRRPLFYRGDRIGYQVGQTPGASTAYRVFVTALYNDNSQAESVARLLGIEYVVVRKDINVAFYNDTDKPSIIEAHLAKMPDIKLIRSFGSWDIYQLSHATVQPVFATDWATGFTGHPLNALASIASEKVTANTFPAIFFSQPIAQPSPAVLNQMELAVADRKPAPALTVTQRSGQYQVSGSSDHPFLLVLNQSNDPLWQASSRDATVGPRAVANGYAPTWLVRPQADHFTVTISYQPQRLFNRLGPISLAMIIGLIILLLAYWRVGRVRAKINLLTTTKAKDL